MSDVTITRSRVTRGRFTHQGTLRAVAITATTEDDDHTALCELATRAQSLLQGVRGVRVVDEREVRLPGDDRLEAAGDVRQSFDPFDDVGGVDIEVERHPERAHAVVHVVPPTSGVDTVELADRRPYARSAPGRTKLDVETADVRVVGSVGQDVEIAAHALRGDAGRAHRRR